MLHEPTSILYIDDDPDDLLIFGESIVSLYPDITILKAQSGEEGIAILNRLEHDERPFPSLIMLDMNMPRMNGKQILQLIRSNPKWEKIPVVIFTTSSNISDIEFCKTYRTNCITKPISYKFLNQTIQQVFAHSNIPLNAVNPNS